MHIVALTGTMVGTPAAAGVRSKSAKMFYISVRMINVTITLSQFYINGDNDGMLIWYLSWFSSDY